MWWMRARGLRPWSLTACSDASSTALAPSEIWLAIAAVSRPPSTSVLSAGHLLQRRVARALVGDEAVDRDDLVLEVAGADRRLRALVAGQRVLLHLLAGDVPLLGDQLRTAELRDLLVAVAVQPALGLVGGRGEPELLADDHRRRDRDLAHVLHAAGHDQIGGAGHDRLCAKGNGLLAGTALPVDGDTGHLFGIAGGQPRQPGDVAGLRSDGVDAAGDHVVDRAGVDVDAVEQAAPRRRSEVDGMHAGQRPVALADRGAHSVDDVRLRRHSHVSLLLCVMPPRTMARYCRPTCSAVSGPPG